MQRVLIVASVVLALVVGWLLWQRTTTKPAVSVAATAPAEPAPPPRPEPVKPPEPAPRPLEPAEPVAAAPAPVEAARPVEAAKPALRPAPKRPRAAALDADLGDRPTEGTPVATPRPRATKPPPPPVVAEAPAARPPAPPPAPPAPPPAVAQAPAAKPPPAPPPAPAARAAPAPGASSLRTDLPGAVAGTLRDAAGGPIAGATVVALSADGQEAFESVTGDDGFFLMAAMRPGRYVLFPGLGTSLGARLAAQPIEVRHATVHRVELREPAGGATVRVRSLRANGLPARAQVVLVRGRVASPASLAALLGGEGILLPERRADADVLRRVPAGEYTVVVLQGDAAPRVVREPVTVAGEGEQVLDLRLPADLAAAGDALPAAG